MEVKHPNTPTCPYTGRTSSQYSGYSVQPKAANSSAAALADSTAAAVLGISCGCLLPEGNPRSQLLLERTDVRWRSALVRFGHAISMARLVRPAKYRGLDEHAYFDQGGTTPFVRA